MQDFLKEVIKEAGYIAKGYYHEGVEKSFKSGPTDIVTVADLAVSDFIVDKIKHAYPDHGVISEEVEEELNPSAEYTWVIDPIDGTHNFSNHISEWCVMIGLMKNRKPYLGAIYDAMNDELFFAEVGKGAFLNDKPIKVSDCDDIKAFTLVFQAGAIRAGSPYSSTQENYTRYLNFYKNLMGDDGHWVGSTGSRLTMCRVACGRLDAMIVNAGVFHDNLPGYVICTEAGAVFTNSKGLPWQYDEMDLLVANPKLHQKLLELF
ncbi:MAG: hypothetical protein ACD_72C00186G0002 [uncultured bacterium]|nr:MAG: hypothetical protein ACD_72C00186G0002 [uncultured bacterium]